METTTEGARARLDQLLADRAEARRLAAARTRLEPRLQAARAEVDERRRRVDTEAADVDRLDRPSASRLLASLGGTLTERRAREEAEVEQARFALQQAQAQLADLAQEADRLDGERARLRGAEEGFEEALADLVLAARVDPSAGDVAREATHRLEAIQRRREVEEALAAGEVATKHLGEAQRRYSHASDWSGVDTFLDGGMFTSMMKHDRIDKATEELRLASVAVERFSRELADVELPGLAVPIVDDFERGIDIFFDNIFTDWSVRSRIKDAQAQVDAAVAEVATTMDRLEHLHRALVETDEG